MNFTYYVTPLQYQTAEAHGISAELLNWRVRGGGWNAERATTTTPRVKTKWLEIAKSNGITPQTYYKRVGKLGWTEDKAATTPTMTRDAIVRLMADVRRKGVTV